MEATARIAAFLIFQLYSPDGAHMHPPESAKLKQHVDQFSRFAWQNTQTHRYTSRHTMVRQDFYTNSPHLSTEWLRCGLKMFRFYVSEPVCCQC